MLPKRFERLRELPWGAVFLAALAVLFLIANRAAYETYFGDDDFNMLTWAIGSLRSAFYWLVTPQLHPGNFRPVGGIIYQLLAHTAGLRFAPYVAVIQAIHLLNLILLYLVLRRLNFDEFAAGAGVLFYSFTAATLHAYWAPMYLYDVTCATFCLLTLWFYMRGNWLAGLFAFWLAYKSKELAVMLPLALAAYQLMMERRRWKRLIPYFLISLGFGVQGLLSNSHEINEYSLVFTPAALAAGIKFYSSAIFLLPYAGLLLLLVPVFVRDRRLYFGLIAAVSLLFPMLVLPGRLASVYWYVPLTGVAIMVASVASQSSRWVVGGLFAFWLAVNYLVLCDERTPAIDLARERRAYVEAMSSVGKQYPNLRAVVYDQGPRSMHAGGVDGVVHILLGPYVETHLAADIKREAALRLSPMAFLKWDQVRWKLSAEVHGE